MEMSGKSFSCYMLEFVRLVLVCWKALTNIIKAGSARRREPVLSPCYWLLGAIGKVATQQEHFSPGNLFHVASCTTRTEILPPMHHDTSLNEPQHQLYAPRHRRRFPNHLFMLTPGNTDWCYTE